MEKTINEPNYFKNWDFIDLVSNQKPNFSLFNSLSFKKKSIVEKVNSLWRKCSVKKIDEPTKELGLSEYQIKIEKAHQILNLYIRHVSPKTEEEKEIFNQITSINQDLEKKVKAKVIVLNSEIESYLNKEIDLCVKKLIEDHYLDKEIPDLVDFYELRDFIDLKESNCAAIDGSTWKRVYQKLKFLKKNFIDPLNEIASKHETILMDEKIQQYNQLVPNHLKMKYASQILKEKYIKQIGLLLSSIRQFITVKFDSSISIVQFDPYENFQSMGQTERQKLSKTPIGRQKVIDSFREKTKEVFEQFSNDLFSQMKELKKDCANFFPELKELDSLKFDKEEFNYNRMKDNERIFNLGRISSLLAQIDELVPSAELNKQKNARSIFLKFEVKLYELISGVSSKKAKNRFSAILRKDIENRIPYTKSSQTIQFHSLKGKKELSYNHLLDAFENEIISDENLKNIHEISRKKYSQLFELILRETAELNPENPFDHFIEMLKKQLIKNIMKEIYDEESFAIAAGYKIKGSEEKGSSFDFGPEATKLIDEYNKAKEKGVQLPHDTEWVLEQEIFDERKKKAFLAHAEKLSGDPAFKEVMIDFFKQSH